MLDLSLWFEMMQLQRCETGEIPRLMWAKWRKSVLLLVSENSTFNLK
jgi:hypothetical protein